MNRLTDFKVGDTVQLTERVWHERYVGSVGKVSKVIKCRDMVEVEFPGGGFYGARPENLAKIEESEEECDFDVRIEEKLVKIVTVKARNALEAEHLASVGWRNSDYVLDADCFAGVEFHAERRSAA